MPRVPFHSIFQPPAVYISESGSVGLFTTKTPNTWPTKDPYQKFPRKPPWPVPSTYPVTAQVNFHHVLPATLLLKLYSNTHPSTQPSYHPYQYTTTSSTRFTPTPSQTWAIPGRLGRPHGSHCTRFQDWIPLSGPLTDAYMIPVMYRG